jgi:hypothetical protein
MILSGFTQLGFLQLSAGPSLPERVYQAIWSNWGERLSKDGYTDAKAFAWAMGLARSMRAAQLVEAQIDPLTVLDLLPARELEYGIIVPEDATIAERRGELAAQILLALGGIRSNIRQALADALGDDFRAYRIEVDAEIQLSPSDPGAVGNFVKPTVPRRTGRLFTPISVGLGASQQVKYKTIDLGAVAPADYFQRYDWIVVDTDDPDRLERVQIEAVATYGDGPRLTATFANAHDAGAVFATMPFPYWLSTKCRSLVVLTDDAAAEPAKRAKVHRIMRQMARSVCTWAIAGTSSDAFTTGPFEVGVGKLGITTLGELAI